MGREFNEMFCVLVMRCVHSVGVGTTLLMSKIGATALPRAF